MTRSIRTVVWFLLIFGASAFAFEKASSLPEFGRDTVLVWNILNSGDKSNFVVRIAEFLPDRFVEWEDSTTQGTIFMDNRAITGAKSFLNANLFQAGVDTKGKDATTLWLSRRIFSDLKQQKSLKVNVDGVVDRLTVLGGDSLTVEINRTPLELPVIKVADERGSERWFLDSADNPLLVRHVLRQYDQVLASITTDKTNTLRWIKGKKLTAPR